MSFTTLVGPVPTNETEPPRPTITAAGLAPVKRDDAALIESPAAPSAPAEADKGSALPHRAEAGNGADALTEDDDLGSGQELTELGRDMLASFQQHALDTKMSKK